MGTWAGLPEEVGLEEQEGGRCQKKPKKLGQHVRQGWVQEAAAAAGSEHEGPASHVERGKGLHSVPLASNFPICEETASASGGPLTESIRKMVMS